MKANVPFSMNSKQKKAMNLEINKQIIENETNFAIENDAAILWTLHEVFGFGKKRLRRFWDAMNKNNEITINEFEDPDSKGSGFKEKLCLIKVDVEDWHRRKS